MRIVHGLHWCHGGIVKFIELMLFNLTDKQNEHHLVFLNADMPPDQLREYSYTCLGYEKNSMGALILFAKLMRKLKPDIFHAHSLVPGLLGRLLSPNETICTATIHNEYPHYKSRSMASRIKLQVEYQSLKRRCQSVICVSESVRQLVDQVMPGLPLEVIQNGVPQDMLHHATKKDNGHPPTILSLGRLDAQKGYDLLLDAISILHAEGVDAHLRIVGEGALRQVLEAQALKLGIKENVVMPGFSRNTIAEFANADIFVCSSRYEGFSLAIAEAMSFGLPLVTTRVGGVASMARDRVEALVVPCNDPLALANAIRELIRNPALRLSLGEAGRIFVKNNFDVRDTASRYEKLYQQLLQKR